MRIVLALVVMMMIALVGLPPAAVAQCDYTHGELVDYLINVAGLQKDLPKGIALLTPDEAYLAKVRLLISKDFPRALDGFERGYPIDRGYFVSMVFEAMKDELTCLPEENPDKVSCLDEAGLTPEDIETRLCKECQSVTHGELIDLIVKLGGLRGEIERDLQGKSADEQYRVEVNYLLSLAFPRRLDGYIRQFMITRSYFAEVVYDIFSDRIGCPASVPKEKAICLVNAGYLSSDDLARTLCRDEVVVSLLNVSFMEFQPPGPPERPISPTR